LLLLLDVEGQLGRRDKDKERSVGEENAKEIPGAINTRKPQWAIRNPWDVVNLACTPQCRFYFVHIFHMPYHKRTLE